MRQTPSPWPGTATTVGASPACLPAYRGHDLPDAADDGIWVLLDVEASRVPELERMGGDGHDVALVIEQGGLGQRCATSTPRWVMPNTERLPR